MALPSRSGTCLPASRNWSAAWAPNLKQCNSQDQKGRFGCTLPRTEESKMGIPGFFADLKRCFAYGFMLRICAFFLLVVSAAAQSSILDVVNAASRIPIGFPGWGVAQGALSAVIGKGLGPDDLQKADFPLPTTDGLAGVT